MKFDLKTIFNGGILSSNALINANTYNQIMPFGSSDGIMLCYKRKQVKSVKKMINVVLLSCKS